MTTPTPQHKPAPSHPWRKFDSGYFARHGMAKTLPAPRKEHKR